MKKILLSSVGVLVLSGLAYGLYQLNSEKVYSEKDVKCDFDAGICYDLKGNKITGRIKNYDNKILISDIEYKNGKEDGELKIYRNDGTIFLEGTYKQGKPNGIVKEYNEDGTLLSYDEFKDGTPHGKSIIYQKDNKILKEWHYNMGKETKVGKVYYQDGTPQLEVDFDNGTLKYYYENGQLQTLAHFNDSGYNGLWSIYNEDGSLKAELTYENNLGTSGYCLNKDNTKVEFDAKAFETFATTNQTPCDTQIPQSK